MAVKVENKLSETAVLSLRLYLVIIWRELSRNIRQGIVGLNPTSIMDAYQCSSVLCCPVDVQALQSFAAFVVSDTLFKSELARGPNLWRLTKEKIKIWSYQSDEY
jgi:hypothetical protein